MRQLSAMILAAAITVTGGAALGADGAPPADPGDCTVAPAPEAVPGDMTTGNDESSLSDVLDPCAGVLEPAPVGDEDLTVVPPPVGRTPVIAPDEVPQQPAEGG